MLKPGGGMRRSSPHKLIAPTVPRHAEEILGGDQVGGDDHGLCYHLLSFHHPDREQLGLALVLGADGDPGSRRSSRRCSSCSLGRRQREEAVDEKVGQAVGADEAADLLDVVSGGDELALVGVSMP